MDPSKNAESKPTAPSSSLQLDDSEGTAGARETRKSRFDAANRTGY